MSPPIAPSSRRLFLDDDPTRAKAFLHRFPQAIWVQTVEECLACLEETWDEIHLDHDLGGQTEVDFEREDCGMAVVRWIIAVPRPQLASARFVVHTRNPNAACLMVTHLQVAGYNAEARPFPALFDQARRPGGPERRLPSHGVLRGLMGRLRRFVNSVRQRVAPFNRCSPVGTSRHR